MTGLQFIFLVVQIAMLIWALVVNKGRRGRVFGICCLIFFVTIAIGIIYDMATGYENPTISSVIIQVGSFAWMGYMLYEIIQGTKRNRLS